MSDSPPGEVSAERHFKITGMDCAEEVPILKSEVGPGVGGEQHLSFEVLNGRMTVAAAAGQLVGRGIGQPLLAIVHHKMGHEENALHSFEQSQALLDGMLDDSVNPAQGTPSIPWIDWIESSLITKRRAWW